jgi:hypothetical protein
VACKAVAVAPAAIAPKKARLSIVSSSMHCFLKSCCLLISSGTTASVPKFQRCCQQVQQFARKALRGGVAPAFAETDPLSRDGEDIVLSERAKRSVRYQPHAGLAGAPMRVLRFR